MASSMLALFGFQFGQVASAVIIGNLLGSAALSTMAVILPLQSLFSMAGALLGVGTTVVCARAIGKGQFALCHRVFTLGYALTLVTAVFLALVLLLFLNPLIRFLGAGNEIFEDTRRFAFILISGGLFTMSIFPAFNLLRMDGRSRSSVLIFLIMAAVNITLSFILIAVFHLGIEAAALASAAAFASAGVLGAVILFTGSKNFHFTRSIFSKQFRGEVFSNVKNIAAAGSPNAMEYLCIMAYSVVINRLIAASFGVTGLSTFKLIDSINAAALIFIYGVTGPTVQFISVFDAEKDSKSIRQLLIQALRWGGLFILVYTAACEFFAPQIARIFGMSSEEILIVAVPAIRIFGVSIFLALINNVLFCVYQGEGRPLLSNILTVLRLLFWIVIAAPILSARLGINGIWHSFWLAEFLTLLIVAVLSLRYRRRRPYLTPLLLIDTEAEAKGVFKSFSVNNTLENITQSSEGISEFCEQNTLGPKLTMAISLAIEETLVLIREHCFLDKDDTMNARVLITEDKVILRIRNGGRYFNPLDYAKDPSGAEDIMGIKMILALALNIDYHNTFGINNTTVLLQRKSTERAA